MWGQRTFGENEGTNFIRPSHIPAPTLQQTNGEIIHVHINSKLDIHECPEVYSWPTHKELVGKEIFSFCVTISKGYTFCPTSPPNLIFSNSSLPHSIPTTLGSLLDSLCSLPGTLLPNRLCTSYSLSLEWSFPQMLIWFILTPLSVLKCHLLCEAFPTTL